MKINERILRNIIFESINEEFENNDFVSEFFRPEADFQAYEKKDSDKKGKKSDKKKDSDKKEKSGGKEMSPEKRKAIEDDLSDFFENDGVNKAAYAYKLFGVEPEEGKDTNDEKNARGLFAKKLDHEKDRSTGYVYSFSSEELNRLESMKNDKLDESRLRNIVGESIKKVLREGIIPKYENPVYIECNSKEDADISVEIGYSDYSSSLFYVGECGTDGYAALEAVVNYLVENGIIDHYAYDEEDLKDYAIEDFIEVNGYYLPRWEVHINQIVGNHGERRGFNESRRKDISRFFGDEMHENPGVNKEAYAKYLYSNEPYNRKASRKAYEKFCDKLYNIRGEKFNNDEIDRLYDKLNSSNPLDNR